RSRTSFSAWLKRCDPKSSWSYTTQTSSKRPASACSTAAATRLRVFLPSPRTTTWTSRLTGNASKYRTSVTAPSQTMRKRLRGARLPNGLRPRRPRGPGSIASRRPNASLSLLQSLAQDGMEVAEEWDRTITALKVVGLVAGGIGLVELELGERVEVARV